MTSPTLRRFLEHALEVHAPSLEHSFPGCFDWQRLVCDTPAMAERLSGGRFDTLDSIATYRLQRHADAVFRAAHTTALAVLCAAADEEVDPEEALERFDEAPEDEEEERFELLAAEVLGPAEAFLADPAVALDERGVEVQQLHALAWPHVSEMVARLGLAFAEEEDDDAPETLAEEQGVLVALARVACLLATLRWLAADGDLEG